MTGKLMMLLISIALCGLIVAAAPQKKGEKKGGAARAETATVKVSNFKFEPKELTVKAGTTVTWEVDGGTHAVISDGKTFSSQGLSKGNNFSHKFTKAGKYPYYCNLHGQAGGKDMAGTIIVTK